MLLELGPSETVQRKLDGSLCPRRAGCYEPGRASRSLRFSSAGSSSSSSDGSRTSSASSRSHHSHWARVLDHLPPPALHDDVRGRLLDDRCRIRELSPDPPGWRSGEAIHRRVAVPGGWLVASVCLQ